MLQLPNDAAQLWNMRSAERSYQIDLNSTRGIQQTSYAASFATMRGCARWRAEREW